MIPESGEVVRSVDFVDGRLAVSVMANGEPVDSRIQVYPAGEDDRVATQHPDADDRDHPATFGLSPGDYDIEVRPKNLDVADQRVERVRIDKGQTVSRTVVFRQNE
jgi:hypothetical protein